MIFNYFFMSKLQEVFNRIKESKEEQTKIRRSYKDSLDNSQEYKTILEKLKVLKENKKQIEERISSDFKTELSRLDTIKLDIAHDIEMMSDLALNQLVEGKVIEIKDKNDNNYEPLFKVTFKKI